jgi:hypothetical protein
MNLSKILIVITVALGMLLPASMGAKREGNSLLRAVPPQKNPLLEVRPPLIGTQEFKGKQEGDIVFNKGLLYNTNNETNKNKGAFPFFVNDKKPEVLELFDAKTHPTSYQEYVYDKQKNAYVHGESSVSFSMRGADKGRVREDINGVQFNGRFHHKHMGHSNHHHHHHHPDFKRL